MNSNEWPKHLYALDISRGIASLAVVLWHWQHFAYKGNSLPQEFLRENQPLYELLSLFYEKGGMGVQYFFLLSGFIFFWLYIDSIKKKITGALEFGVNRFSRLYPLHFLTLVTVAILQYIYTSRENVPFVYPFNDAYHFILNIGFASKWGFESGWSFNAPVWSVSIEVLLYGIFFLIASLRLGGWVYCLSVSVISFVASYFIYHSLFIGLAMFFLGGLVFHAANLLLKKHRSLIAVVYLVAVFSWVGVIVNYYIFSLSSYIKDIGMLGKIFLTGFPMYILFPATVLSLVLVEINRGPLLKRLSWIGDITYSSYLLHFPLQLLFGLAISFGILGHAFYLNSIYLIAFFVLLISLSYMTFVKFERPMQKIIRAKLLKQQKA